MNSQFDKLGKLLNEAIKKGDIPQKNTYKNNQSEYILRQSVYKIRQYIKVFNIKEEEFSLNLVKEKYHELLKEYHPDTNIQYQNNQKISSEKILELKNAYNKIIEWYNKEGYLYFD